VLTASGRRSITFFTTINKAKALQGTSFSVFLIWRRALYVYGSEVGKAVRGGQLQPTFRIASRCLWVEACGWFGITGCHVTSGS
jgi:hypothetical protein